MKIAVAIRASRDDILSIAARHGASNVGLFGSAARGDDSEDSDVDLLVDVNGTPGPWFPGGLAAELEDLLGRPVQIIVRRSLSPLIRDSVLKDAVPL